MLQVIVSFSPEMNELKENLVHALEAKSGSQEEQLSLVQKSSEMNSELIGLQTKLKDEEQKRISLEKSCEEMKVGLYTNFSTLFYFILFYFIKSVFVDGNFTGRIGR